VKTVTAMEVRKGLGGILDEVLLKSETFILERAGKAIAMITPVRKEVANHEQQNLKIKVIEELKGLRAVSPRGADPTPWLTNERDNWGDE